MIAGGIRNVNRFLLFTIVGFLVAGAVTSALGYALWGSIRENTDQFYLSFFVALLEDLLFFGLVGAGLAIAQFYGHHGEVLGMRVRRVFANKDASEKALDYITREISTNAIYNERASHRMEIVEYDSANCAYRVEFKNTYILRNMFGDIEYEARNLRTEIAPDFTGSALSPAAFFHEACIRQGSQTEQYGEPEQEIGPQGYRVPIRKLKLAKNGRATFVMRWWSWVSNAGNSGFSAKRFSENFEVIVENKSRVTARVVTRRDDGAYSQPIAVKSGRSLWVWGPAELEPRVRVEFWWLPPVDSAGHPYAPDPKGGTDGWHPVLDSSHAYGDTKSPDL